MLNAINQQMQRNIAQPRRGVTTIEVGGPLSLGVEYTNLILRTGGWNAPLAGR